MADRFDDVESQSSGSAGERGKLPEEWVGTTLSPDKVLHWKTKVGTYPTGPKGHYNPHGLLAAARYVLERKACIESLEGGDHIVVDVGGAPHRTFRHLGERGRYLMPNLHHGDKTRFLHAPPGARDHICHHRFEECTCHHGQKRAYVFTHSAYYIEPMSLWKTLNEDEVVDCLVVEHVFDDAFGGYGPEASWSVHRGQVSMTVEGNAGRAYTHKLPPWQEGWVGPGGESFAVETLEVLDDFTYLVRVMPTKREGYAPREITWREIEADPWLSGPVQFTAGQRNAVPDNAKFTQVSFDVNNVHRFGPFLYTDFLIDGERVQLSVPVNGVAAVAEKVLNQERNAALYETATHILKTQWARCRVPAVTKPQVMAATIALGFVVNLKVEVNTTYTMLERFSWLMNIHSILLKFGHITVRSRYWLLLPILIAICALIAFDSVEDDNKIIVVVTLITMLLLILSCLCCSGVMKLYRAWETRRELGWLATYGDPDGPRVPLLGHDFRFTRSLGLPGSRYVRPDATDITGRLSLGTSREKDAEPSRMLVSGIVTDGAATNALHTTQQAERSAVTNRILATRRNPAEEDLKLYEASYNCGPFELVAGKVDNSRENFNEWVNKLKKTYPKVYCDAMVDAWVKYQGVECPPAPTRGFLKIEKSAKTVKTNDATATKPRLIQPPEDVDKAITGPIVWQLYEFVRDAWDGVKTNVLYASGRSCAYIGTVVDSFIDEHKDVVAWPVDMACYDATLSLPLQQPALSWYSSRLGMPVWVQTWLKRIRTRGVTPNGVYYMPERIYFFDAMHYEEVDVNAFVAYYRRQKFKIRVESINADTEDGEGRSGWKVTVEDFQMTSGRMDTNLTDTVALVATFTRILTSLGIPYLLLACGDDGFLMLKKEHAFAVDMIKKHQIALGLNPEGEATSDRSKWEFCSKLFWFGVDLKTGKTQTVLGSKPFRGIARMGMNTTLPGAANAAAAALSVRIDSGHVPFLGEFADRTYELCKEFKIRQTGRPEWTAIRGDRRFGPSPFNLDLSAARYGLGQENLVEFKSRLQTLGRPPCVLHWSPMEGAVAVDEA
jgi:hypothetical protein